VVQLRGGGQETGGVLLTGTGATAL
jgi:hypothetical protein